MEKKEVILESLKSEGEMSTSRISVKLGTNYYLIEKYLNELLSKNKV